MAQTILGLLEIQSQIQNPPDGGDEYSPETADSPDLTEEIEQARAVLDRLQVEPAAFRTEADRKTLAQKLNAVSEPSPSELIAPRINYINSLIELGRLQNIANPARPYGDEIESLMRRSAGLSKLIDEIRISQPDDESLTNEQKAKRLSAELAKFPEVSRRAAELLKQVESVVRPDDRLSAARLVDEVAKLGRGLLKEEVGGLVPIDIEGDEGMLTALVTRFDLMNQRGALADAWRQIKLRGDDLRSVLNLRASQSIRTDSTNNQPFDFTFDDSQTRVGLTFDLPLNRRAQRNAYRIALIDYNVALRNLMRLEDEIKFSIRSDLRNLQLDREQYAIAVASAALASDRRLSTRAQLRLGRDNITARDVLEAQQAYTSSLNGVASAHIDYILDRVDLFLDLELLQVDESVFWPQLYDEGHQPQTRTQPPAHSGPAYGCLVPRLRYSDCIRRMDCLPFGEAEIFDHGDPKPAQSVIGPAVPQYSAESSAPPVPIPTPSQRP